MAATVKFFVVLFPVNSCRIWVKFTLGFSRVKNGQAVLFYLCTSHFLSLYALWSMSASLKLKDTCSRQIDYYCFKLSIREYYWYWDNWVSLNLDHSVFILLPNIFIVFFNFYWGFTYIRVIQNLTDSYIRGQFRRWDVRKGLMEFVLKANFTFSVETLHS